MKTILILSFLSLTMPVNAQSDLNKTGNWYNGRYWGKLSNEGKVFFINGMADGVAATIMNLPLDLSDSDVELLQREFTAIGFTNKEVAYQISLLYSDVRNIKIPIAFAYIYSTYFLNNKDKHFLIEFLDIIRKGANEME